MTKKRDVPLEHPFLYFIRQVKLEAVSQTQLHLMTGCKEIF